MTKRTLKDHIITSADADLIVTVEDEAGAGNAHHRYEVVGFTTANNSSFNAEKDDSKKPLSILFQNGTIPENGRNGITQEVLITIVIDRLRSFQSGDFACRENAIALTKLEEALHWLQQRTIRRVRQGIEGQHKEV